MADVALLARGNHDGPILIENKAALQFQNSVDFHLHEYHLQPFYFLFNLYIFKQFTMFFISLQFLIAQPWPFNEAMHPTY